MSTASAIYTSYPTRRRQLGRSNVIKILVVTPSYIALMRDTLFQHSEKMASILDEAVVLC
jgi:dihydrodipicolinate synthase/N-acetylneuraminate lyase